MLDYRLPYKVARPSAPLQLLGLGAGKRDFCGDDEHDRPVFFMASESGRNSALAGDVNIVPTQPI